MDEKDIGKVFLLAVPWDWTWVGRLEGFIGDRVIIAEAGYFTHTGATFDILCKEGFTSSTKFHRVKTSGGRVRIPNAGIVMPFEAPWPQKENR